MRTRALETKAVARAAVVRAEVSEVAGSSLVLRTTAPKARRADPYSWQASFLGEVEGRVRIDVLADNLVRLRYAEGDCLPENRTAMVVGEFTGPSYFEIAGSEAGSNAARHEPYLSTSGGERVRITTAALSNSDFPEPISRRDQRSARP